MSGGMFRCQNSELYIYDACSYVHVYLIKLKIQVTNNKSIKWLTRPQHQKLQIITGRRESKGGLYNDRGLEDWIHNGKMPILSKLTFYPIKILADFSIESGRLILRFV